jgi:protein arginine kinase activator
MGLCCGQCGTTLESVRLGSPLGCPECYEIFSDILILEMQKHEKGASPKSAPPLHIGRAPGEDTKAKPALRLLALNEALSETLNREDYEQAAWLRDQIKVLSDAESGEGMKDDGET